MKWRDVRLGDMFAAAGYSPERRGGNRYVVVGREVESADVVIMILWPDGGTEEWSGEGGRAYYPDDLLRRWEGA